MMKEAEPSLEDINAARMVVLIGNTPGIPVEDEAIITRDEVIFLREKNPWIFSRQGQIVEIPFEFDMTKEQ